MNVEASDINQLLRNLGRSDPTCRVMAEWADHGSTPVLEVCQEALSRLASEKARLAQAVEDMLAALPDGIVSMGSDKQAPYDGSAPMA